MKYLILVSILLSNVGLKAQKKQITLEDIWKTNAFRQEMVMDFRSMNDGVHYSEKNDKGELVQVNFSDSKVDKVLANLKDISFAGNKLEVDDYTFNEDETKLLLLTESENIYRRSVLNKVYLFDLKTKEVTQVFNDKVLHASFSPSSDKIAYVFNNNLYYYDIMTKATVAITTNGDYNHINGNCDWVYEEEFEFTKAYEWSAKGDYLVYYQFDQTEVPEYNFAIYDNLYPTDYRYKYPKAGEKNSKIGISIFHLATQKNVQCNLGTETDIYIPRIKVNSFNNSVVVYRLNRLQNNLDLLQVNQNTGTCDVIYSETNKTYVEINDNILFLLNRNAFVYTSEKDGWNHIYLHDIQKKSSMQLTRGQWEVTEIAGVDEANKKVYYVSTEKSPLERNLYSIGLDGKKQISLTPEQGWHSISFSANYNYYVDKYSTSSQAPIYTLVNKLNGTRRILKDNAKLMNKLKDYDLSKLEFIKVPNEKGVELNGWMIKPSNFSPAQKYPLLMFQYSGPGSQQVTNQFGGRDFWWYQMLAQNGYIIVCVDGTGTGFRGESFKKQTYLQLGKYESDDQIAVAKYFAKQSYIDAGRIGIWGWSYGGFMSSICILKGADVFKTAIAVAPVTNWRYYDNIYTERYMRTPQENTSGYDDNSPVNMVQNLKGNYLLIHGSADDNVHFQNATMMIDGLIKANKDFDSEVYPNKNHGISGGVTRLQLYRKLTNFIFEKL